MISFGYSYLDHINPQETADLLTKIHQLWLVTLVLLEPLLLWATSNIALNQTSYDIFSFLFPVHHFTNIPESHHWSHHETVSLSHNDRPNHIEKLACCAEFKKSGKFCDFAPPHKMTLAQNSWFFYFTRSRKLVFRRLLVVTPIMSYDLRF